MYILDFLCVGKYAYKEEFLQHITELIQVPLKEDHTLESFLDYLKEWANERNDMRIREAVYEFIEFQKKHYDKERFSKKLDPNFDKVGDWKDNGEKHYVIFNLYKK